MMVAVFIWFGFLSCVEAPQSTTKPPSEIVNDTEVRVMDTKKSVPITMALRIPRDVRVELIDGIAVEYSLQHVHTTDGSTEGALIGELTVDGNSTYFELELEAHSFQELRIGERLIRLSATGFSDFGLQVEVLDKPSTPLNAEEVRDIFDGLDLGSICGQIRRLGDPLNGIWYFRTKGRCKVEIGQYSGRVLYIEHPQNTDLRE